MKTKKAYEEYLNDESWDYVWNYIKQEYGHCCSNNSLVYYWLNCKVGTLQRRYDKTRFEVGYNEWKNE